MNYLFIFSDAKSGFQLEISTLQESLVNAHKQIAKLNQINEELKKNNEYLKLKEQELSTQIEITTRQMNNLKDDYELYHGQAKKLSEEKEELLSVIFEGEKKRREMHNLIQDLKGELIENYSIIANSPLSEIFVKDSKTILYVHFFVVDSFFFIYLFNYKWT